MSYRRWLVCVLLGCSSSLQAESAGDSLEDYSSRVELQLQGTGPWYRLELPMQAQLAAAYADLRDLRIFNAEGERLAYSLISATQSSTESRISADLRLFPLYGQSALQTPQPAVRVRRDAKGTIVELEAADPDAQAQVLRGWLLDASGLDASLQQLQLQWSGELEGFQRFSIEGSDNLADWSPLAEGQIARLSFNGERIDKDQIHLPSVHSRYLRLLWQQPEQAVTLTAARASGVQYEQHLPEWIWSPPRGADASSDGWQLWRLPLALPLRQLQIEVGQNALAPIQLEGRSSAAEQWRPLARTVLYRLAVDGGELVEDKINLPPGPVQELRLQVDNRGAGLAVQNPRLSLAMEQTQVVFLLRGSPPYRLALGRTGAQDASLPATTLVPGFNAERLAKMGSATLQGEFSAGSKVAKVEQPEAVFNWHKAVLWGVLGLGVLLLVMMAMSLLRNLPSRDSH